MPGRPAVHEEDGGQRARRRRRAGPAGRARARRARRRPRPRPAPTGGAAGAGRGEDDPAVGGADDGRLGRGGPGVLDGAVGAGRRAGDGAARGRQLLERAGGEVEPVQAGAAAVLGVHEQRRAVLVPVGGQVAGQVVQRQVDLLAGDRVPQERQRPAGALVHGEQPAVARRRGRSRARTGRAPRRRTGRRPPRPSRAAVEPQDAQGAVPAVAVLAVLERDQGLVARQRGDVGVLLVRVQHLRRAGARRADAHGAAVVGGAADHGAGAARSRARPARPRAPRARAGSSGPPAQGWRIQVPNSSPSVSSNHQTCSPSGGSAPSLVPFGRSVTCRVVPASRSQAYSSKVPVALLTNRQRDGASCAQSGRDTRAARTRCSQTRDVGRGQGAGHADDRTCPHSRRAAPESGPTASGGLLVGVTGFEPATSASRTQRATKLRHTPVSCSVHCGSGVGPRGRRL